MTMRMLSHEELRQGGVTIVEFTQEQQRLVLPKVIRPEADMTVFRGLCMAFAHRHNMRKIENTQGREAMIEQLERIRAAFDEVVRALESADPLVRWLLGYGSPWLSGLPKIEPLRSARDNAENACRALEVGAQEMSDRKTKRSGRRTELSTYFCRDARDLYVYLTGNTKIGKEDGPFCQFVQKLGEVFDPELPLTQNSIRAAARRAPNGVDTK